MRVSTGLQTDPSVPETTMKCHRFKWQNVTPLAACHPLNFDNRSTEVCDEHIYNVEFTDSNYGLSIVADLDLVSCKDCSWPLMVWSSFS